MMGTLIRTNDMHIADLCAVTLGFFLLFSDHFRVL